LHSSAISHVCRLNVLVAFLGVVFTHSAYADGQALPTREEIQKWIETNLDTPPKFREGEVLKQADLDKLRPFLPPRYIDEFNFPAVEFHVSPSGNYAPHPDYLAATEKYSRLPLKLPNVTISIN